MKKEKFGFLLLINVIILISITLVSAQNVSAKNYNIDRFIDQMTDSFASIFAPIFGIGVSDQFLFAKILLFFLLFSVVFMVLKSIEIFEDNIVVQVVISVIFGILSVRFLKESELMTAILLPSGVMGVSITIFLPFIAYFTFLHKTKMGTFGRRAGWFIYGVVFLVLWGSLKYSVLGFTNWIYLLGLGFIIISFLFDRSIHSYFGLAGLERWRENVEDARIAKLQVEYQDLALLTTPSAHARRRMKTIERLLKRNRAWPP